MCMEAVKQDGFALAYVPEQIKDPEICFEAVRNNNLALQFIPDYFEDKDGNLLSKDEMECVWAKMYNEEEDEGPTLGH